MQLTLNKVAAALVAVAMMGGLAVAFTAQRAHALSLAELVDLFIALDVIPADKAEQARTVLSGKEETSSTPACNFTRNLTTGDTGADVKDLQKLLNGKGFMVAAAGAGSAGMESEYYGPATAAAVAKMQEAFASEILAPLGLSAGTGTFGAATRAKANSLCAAAPVVPPVTPPSDDDEDTSDLSGEGTLKTYEMDDADDTELMEGDEESDIAVVTVEAEDGDILLDRMTFEIAGTSAEEDDPWDVFEAFSLWVDGEMIAEFEADDEDNYLSENDGEFRFSGIDFVLGEDEEVEITVAATVAGSVDGAGTDQDWTLTGTAVRYFDADDVSEDDATTDELPTASADFEIDVAGADDDAEIGSNSSNPDEGLIQVETDDEKTDEVSVFVFDIEVGEDSSALEVNDVYLDVEVSNAVVGATTTTAEEVIDSVYLTIDGKKVKGDADAVIDDAIASTTSETVKYTFEFDGIELDADTDYEAEVTMVFEGQNTDDYEDGVTVQVTADAEVSSFEWEVEGIDDDHVLTGSEVSEVHTLQGVVPTVSDASVDTDRSEGGDSGTFSFEFTIAADGDDDVTFDTTSSTTVALDGSDDITFTITGATTTPSGIATAAFSLVSSSDDATYSGGTWTVEEGDEATFVLDVTVTTTGAGDNGAYRVRLDDVAGVEVDLLSGSLTLTAI